MRKDRKCGSCGKENYESYPTRSNLCKECHRADMRQRQRRYQAEFPYYQSSSHANVRAKQLGIPGRLSKADVREVMSSGKCSYCGERENLCIDHVTPMSRGGANDRRNITSACRACNSSKKNYLLSEWTGRKGTSTEVVLCS